MEHLPPPQCQIAAGDVQAGHEQVAAGGGLGQVDDLPHIARMHVGPDEQQAGLGQAAAALVHGDGRHVRPRCHGRHRQAVAEVEVGAVGFIGKAEHPGVMSHLDDGPQVGADAVVGGVVHQHGHRVGVLLDGLFHLLRFMPSEMPGACPPPGSHKPAPRRRAPARSVRCGARCGAK